MQSWVAFGIGAAIGCALCSGWRRWQRDRQRQRLRQRWPRLGERPDPLPTLQEQLEQAREQQQRLEIALAEARLRLTRTPIGQLLIDAQGHLEEANPAAIALLDLVGMGQGPARPLLERVRCFELEGLIHRVRQSLAPESLCWDYQPPGRTVQLLPLPPLRPLEALAVPLEAGRTVVFLQDRRPIADLTAQRNRWVSDVAHELKTPLTSLRLLAENLQARVSPQQQRFTDQLVTEVQRLAQLVQDLLELSRLEQQSGQELHYGDCDLVSLIEGVWQSLEPISEARQVALFYQGPDHFRLQADSPRLFRVLLNLIDNALRFSPEGACVQVQLTEHPDSVELAVIDEGPGFAPADLPQVFERFYRGDPSRVRYSGSQGSQGSGLGLAIASQIVEAHGGTIRAENHPEAGGWLQLTLPRQRPANPGALL